jgi:hypothetical protein
MRAALRSKMKDWLDRNQVNMFEWSIKKTCPDSLPAIRPNTITKINDNINIFTTIPIYL